MCFSSTTLVCVGDDGVWSLTDSDGDGRADGEPRLLLKGAMQRGHSANGVIRGPDGWFYLACGNDAGINESHALLPGSPVKEVNAGAIVRISPDGKYSEVVAHGLRNPYDIAFDRFGQLFTVDADGERDRHLPVVFAQPVVRHRARHASRLGSQGLDARLESPGRLAGCRSAIGSHRARLPDGNAGLPPSRFSGTLFRGRVQRLLDLWSHLFLSAWRDGIPATRPRGKSFWRRPEKPALRRWTWRSGRPATCFVAIGGRGTRGSVFRVRYMDSLRPRPDQDKLLRAGPDRRPAAGQLVPRALGAADLGVKARGL